MLEQCSELKAWIEPFSYCERSFGDSQALIREADEIGDEALVLELAEELSKVDKQLGELELRKMLSHELDRHSCFLSINSGAGGTEACDWASMLARMYQRYASKKNWGVEIVECVEGDVAGFKSVTYKITGPFAYGYCKAERGVHRLVRISPFDANKKRHTSFASVDVVPEIDDDIEVEIRPDDLRIDTYRASGAGGQHVNKTDSAVRITHLPTKIVVACQNQRSQFQNKETCMKMLKAKLYQKQEQEHKEKLNALSGDKMEIAWGSQIRNYVFQPYQMVKDNRTQVEVGSVAAVMDGDLDPFIVPYLKQYGAMDV